MVLRLSKLLALVNEASEIIVLTGYMLRYFLLRGFLVCDIFARSQSVTKIASQWFWVWSWFVVDS